MRRLPLYDETAPVACSLGTDELSERLQTIDRIRLALLRVEHTEHGLLLHLAPDAETEALARTFAVEEKACCGFWGFEVRTDDGLTLRWDAPPSARPLLDRLESVLTGDGDVEELAGLL